jgi:hypothetical protein
MDEPRPTRSPKALADVIAAVERRRAAHADLMAKLQTVSGRATSENRMVTVRVGEQGQVADIVFATRAYRSMAPAELSRILLETISKARADALTQVRTATSGLSIGGTAIDDLLAGKSQWADIVTVGSGFSEADMVNRYPAGTGTAGPDTDTDPSSPSDDDMLSAETDADTRRVAAFLRRQADREATVRKEGKG